MRGEGARQAAAAAVTVWRPGRAAPCAQRRKGGTQRHEARVGLVQEGGGRQRALRRGVAELKAAMAEAAQEGKVRRARKAARQAHQRSRPQPLSRCVERTALPRRATPAPVPVQLCLSTAERRPRRAPLCRSRSCRRCTTAPKTLAASPTTRCAPRRAPCCSARWTTGTRRRGTGGKGGGRARGPPLRACAPTGVGRVSATAQHSRARAASPPPPSPSDARGRHGPG
jgi:hypothetical protein